MNKLRVATWNAEGMFVEGSKTRRGTPHDAVAVIKKLRADIISIPEFGMFATLTDEIRTTLQALGYEIVETSYKDAYHNEYGMALLSRLPIVHTQTVRFADHRNAIEAKVLDSQSNIIKVLAVHLDDSSERNRLEEIADIAKHLESSGNLPTLLMGDFNAMAMHSNFARLARSAMARSVARRLPHPILKDMALRVNEMALGSTIQYLQDHSYLHDLDPGHKRTISARQRATDWLPHLKLAKIDWIFGSKHFRTHSYRVLPDVGSDHRPVIAELDYSS